MKTNYQTTAVKRKINLPRTGITKNVLPKVSSTKQTITNKNENQTNLKSSPERPITISSTITNTTTSSDNPIIKNKNMKNNITINQKFNTYSDSLINNRYNNTTENNIQNEEKKEPRYWLSSCVCHG